MPRKQQKVGNRTLKRHVATRKTRRTFLIFCEGARTEPEYLEGLRKDPAIHVAAAVQLRVEPGYGRDPRTLVSRAVEARRRAREQDEEIDEVWCVFDVESPKHHPGLLNAIQLAQANDIKLAISNPCFELWLILHFQDHGRALTSDDACRLRRRLDQSTDKGLDSAKYRPHVAMLLAALEISTSATARTGLILRMTIRRRGCTA